MKKKILKKLLNNLPLKILSILISIVIWYVVVSVNDPIVKERFDVPVQVTNEAYIAAGKKTYQIAEEYQTVTVTVTDNNSVVSRLKASDITVTADLTQIVTMDTNPVYVPIKATCSMVKQEKLSTVTATIPVEIEDVDSEKFPITIDAGNTKPAKDYEVGTMTSDPESITISGPTSLINKISSVVAKVDVTNMRNSGTVTADLMIIDKNQDEMPESQMEFLNFDSTAELRQTAIRLKISIPHRRKSPLPDPRRHLQSWRMKAIRLKFRKTIPPLQDNAPMWRRRLT